MREFDIRTDPVRINAPIDVVWSVLTEVDKYTEWNPFTPQAGTDFTIGFHHAWEDLNPGRCFVVYSGDGRYPDVGSCGGDPGARGFMPNHMSLVVSFNRERSRSWFGQQSEKVKPP